MGAGLGMQWWQPLRHVRPCEVGGVHPPHPPGDVLEWPYAVGGGGSPPPWTPRPQTKVTIVGENKIYRWENLVRPFF